MKAVIISIRPKWCELIASGRKTIEVRKTRPKLETPFKCYIYKTGGGGVIGEFVCDKIDHYLKIGIAPDFHIRAPGFGEMDYGAIGLTEQEMLDYGGMYGWHITKLTIYDDPKPITRPPQSWCYVEEI